MSSNVAAFLMMICLAFFAFTTILGWDYYSEKCLQYLVGNKKPVLIGAVPALIMTYVCSSYIFISPMMFGMENRAMAYLLGGVLTAVIAVAVFYKAKK